MLSSSHATAHRTTPRAALIVPTRDLVDRAQVAHGEHVLQSSASLSQPNQLLKAFFLRCACTGSRAAPARPTLPHHYGARAGRSSSPGLRAAGNSLLAGV